ncbi:MAG: cytochrome c peroxidase [Arcobacteraceae bacterium]|jgi:cytochrome c peroxidase|nr:cytochrome c peroxidase [Arcobacteraceae bacterium]
MRYFILTLFFGLIVFAKEPISPIPLNAPYDKQKALLGYRLFMDPILSSTNSVSCASCHDIFSGGADTNKVSFGVYNKKGNIQSPTVLNARYNFKQFWNGRAQDLYQQANGPIHNPVELNMTNKDVEKKLSASQLYRSLFLQIYKTNTIQFSQVIDAIVEFEKALTTPNSRFDRYLRGEKSLSHDEIDGYTLFKQVGCITCHNGINLGGNSMQKIGLFEEYKNQKNYPDLYSITHDPAYKNVFKVPTLRNISQTAPYLHDGSAKTLKDSVIAMSKYQLGSTLTDHEIDKIVKFLETLDGETPKILKEKI